MEYLLLALAGGGVLVWLGTRLRARRTLGRDRATELLQVRKMCDEDIAVLGEELRRLDSQSAAHPLDEAARVDYQNAMNAYGSAQRAVGLISQADEVREVTETLAGGRYSLARAQARVEGRAVPNLEVPCFFNPQHGPSVMEMAFTQRGRGTHKVPACASDVARLRANEKPEIREVEIGGRRVAYFEAGEAFAPYGEGYFSGDSAIQRLFVVGSSWSGEGRRDRGADPLGIRSDDFGM